MTVQIIYKNKTPKKSPYNLVLFVDEKFNISSLKKHISSSEFALISDLIKTRDEKKKIVEKQNLSYRKKVSKNNKNFFKSILKEIITSGKKFYWKRYET